MIHDSPFCPFSFYPIDWFNITQLPSFLSILTPLSIPLYNLLLWMGGGGEGRIWTPVGLPFKAVKPKPVTVSLSPFPFYIYLSFLHTTCQIFPISYCFYIYLSLSDYPPIAKVFISFWKLSGICTRLVAGPLHLVELGPTEYGWNDHTMGMVLQGWWVYTI